MQPQSENNNNIQQTLPTTTNLQLQQQQQQQQSNRKHHHHHQHHHTPKIIKGKKPLSNFKFYLDIRDHQLTKKIEEQISIFGGNLEFFLTESVTHFVTDKSVLPPPVCNNNTLSSRPTTPQTPGTPQTPYCIDQQPHSPYESNLKNVGGICNVSAKKQSRADAMLNRARSQSTTTATPTSIVPEPQQLSNNNKFLQQQPYIIWQTEYALRFFKKITHDLKDYLESPNRIKLNGKSSGSAIVEPISLKGGFIKIEAIKRNQRPYYQLFRKPTAEWPKIELNRDDGAFRLSPKKKDEQIEPAEDTTRRHNLEKQETKMTRKSRSRSSHRGQNGVKKSSIAGVGVTQQKCKQVKQETSEKQCGVCEICKIEYDTLTIHLKTKDHEYFARNSQNFIALDTLIHTSADVNKFLHSNKEVDDNEDKSELEEEMEVVESSGPLDADAPDPLEDIPITVATQLQHQAQHITTADGGKQRLLGYSPIKTPSPTLREKSKRSTKGKHSSEKFQNTIAAVKSPKLASTSPQKKSGSSSVASSALELRNIKDNNTVITATTPTAVSRRKSNTAASAISPPIRAMLPPSLLYKVVETTTGGNCTPPRKTRDAGNTAVTASPSLIVKFKKVRQTELSVLNGEAENFMFPKVRTSSELPTDVDRQTTSENTQMSSTSLDSSNSGSSQQMEVDSEPLPSPKVKTEKNKIKVASKNVIAAAKRSESRSNVKQSFPTAPIQSELTTLKSYNAVVSARTTATASNTMTTASITLPEATRKSSRTATAIVTAATTSSRLLRAAVEAAKNNERLRVNANDSSCNNTSNRRMKSTSLSGTSTMKLIAPKITRRSTTAMTTLVKLEDRMGDNDDSEYNTAKSDDGRKKKVVANVVDDGIGDDSDDEEEDDDDDDDDDDDEDYVGNIRNFCKQKNVSSISNRRNCPLFTTRGQRAAYRATQKCMYQETEEIKSEPIEMKTKVTVKVRTKPPPPPQPPTIFTPPKKTSPHRAFDLRKSQRIPKMTYAFERLPVTDLWYRVFNRQDNCEEQIFEYYGTTKYRKLPYEMGPIPFDRTLDGIYCKLCGKGCVAGAGVETKTIETNGKQIPVAEIGNQNSCESVPKIIAKETHSKSRTEPTTTTTTTTTTTMQTTAPSSPSPSCTASSSNYTHKKLHLLQRYRRDQQELLQRQKEKQQQLKTVTRSESKSSTPDREPHERAGSTHSNASSYASSTGTIFSKKFPHNKHLNKAAFLSLELPPRKSPREHASTLALVSCIIKQRQDSQSKPNSETDEPPPTPPILNEEETTPAPSQLPNVPTEISQPQPAAIRSPRTTRSAAVTPVEELRFATEISENVKRLRRGQNKYDHSPTVVVAKKSRVHVPLDTGSGNGSGKINVISNGTNKKKGRPRKYPLQSTTPIMLKHRRRQIGLHPYATSSSLKLHHHSSYNGGQNKMPSVRKTGSKKGVLEYEVDSAALKALDAANEYTNVRLLEWEIDKYLQIAGCDYDIDEQFAASLLKQKSISENFNDEINPQGNTTVVTTTTNPKVSSTTTTKRKSQVQITVTPPTTDYFSSDFDLYDLFTCPPRNDASIAADQDQSTADGKRRGFSLYNSVALQNYFKKRKNLKCNRTGWPKTQRKKTSARQQQKLNEKISFLQAIGAQPIDDVNGRLVKQELLLDDDESKDQTREDGVITPPDSDIDEEDEDDKASTANDEEEDEVDAEETEQDAVDSIPEEDETIMDSVDREADVEENDDDVDGGAATAEEEDIDMHYELARKRTRRSTVAASSAEKLASATALHMSSCRLDVTASMPSTQMLRNLRRTPQLNGSLGSCVSPSEKAGDNSDIFTVSSDGLDSDLDLSNSHSQFKGSGLMGNAEDNEYDHQHEYCVSHTPKKKFDLAKYASNNAAATTCAAEAATMAAKSLAISQFLKKEVKVQCRRLRAPFRRFRYRR